MNRFKTLLISFTLIFISLFSASVFASSYSGPLYDSGVHLEKDQPYVLLVDNMKDNNVKISVAFFGIKTEDSFYDINDVRLLVNAYPGKIVPFLVAKTAKKKKITKKDYVGLLTRGRLFSGITLIDKTTSPLHKSNEKTDVLDYLNKNKYAIISNTLDEVQTTTDVKNYSQIKFIDNNDNADLAKVSAQLKSNDNYYYSVSTADILGFNDKEFYNLTDEKNVRKFKDVYKKDHSKILREALAKYKELIEENPDKVMWSSGLDARWNFAIPAYNRMIEFSRDFVIGLDPGVRKKFAFKNADHVFKNGVDLRKDGSKNPELQPATSKKIYFVLFLVVIPSIIAIISILIAITRRG